tara:strand:- start:213 stop:641 length:429 start_codon:yes stop_codon:yes gene_type:complete
MIFKSNATIQEVMGEAHQKRKAPREKTIRIVFYIIVYILYNYPKFMGDIRFKRKLLRDWGIIDDNGDLTKSMQERCLEVEGDVYQNIANAIKVTLKYMEYQGSVDDEQDFMDLVEEAIGRMINKYREEINKDKDKGNSEPYQ